MRLLRRLRSADDGAAMATAPEPAPPAEPPAVDELIDEIDALGRDNRARRDPELERRIVRLRHIAGARMIEEPVAERAFPEPDFGALPANGDVPEVDAGELNPSVLRAAILRHGCLLVRGLMDRETAIGLADGIERAFADREAQERGEASGETYYEEFVPDPPFPPVSLRPWIKEAGGVLAADSPRLLFEMLESFERVGLRRVIREYLNDGVVISVHKGTLRKAEPGTPGAWHQDGSFMGDVHALNVWLSLTHCGDDNAPGLDLVPRRLDQIVETGTEGASLPDEVSPNMIEQVLAGKRVVRPVFEPGDVLLFDDLFLHKTGSDPEMQNPRYAVESWFFGASGFPVDYLPLAF